MIRLWLGLCWLCVSSTPILAQFLGGDGSGQSVAVLASVSGCGWFSGGNGSGYASSSLASTFGCIEFMGSGGSGATSVEIKGECVMYWGDSHSGQGSALLPSPQNCLFFAGEEASGYAQTTRATGFVCPSFLASANGNDGYAARSYTEDHAGLCYVATFPIEASPLFGEIRDGRHGYLHWKTFSELNNKGFEVQKSYDGIEWSVLGWVPGAGNSTEVQYYDFWDLSLATGVQYYRFRQIDFDDTESYSNIVALSLEEDIAPQNILQVYPNPVISGQVLHLQAWISFDLSLDIQLHNALGQLLGRYQPNFTTGNSLFNIPTYDLPAGTYFLSIQTTDHSAHWMFPFVVVR